MLFTGAMFMFPGSLAEGPFSLRPGELGTALSLSAELSPDGELESHSIIASHVVPTQKMTYDEVDEAVASGSSEGILESLQTLLEVLHSSENLTQAGDDISMHAVTANVIHLHRPKS